MFIVLVHWRIKSAAAHVAAFQTHWRNMRISNDDHLIGEFLSEPLAADDLVYPVDPMLPNEPVPYASFVNVGLWKDEPSFHAQIGKYIPQPGSALEDFEQYPRRRIALSPALWRRGKFHLPLSSAL